MEGKFSQFNYGKMIVAALVALAVAATMCAPASAFAAEYKAASIKAESAESTVSTQASTLSTCAKGKTLKKMSGAYMTQTLKKYATKVKRGTTKLNVKTQGYIKFTAPKTKKYSFKFSKLTGAYAAHTTAMMPSSYNPSYCYSTKLSTKGGKDSTLRLSKKGYDGKTGKVVYRYLSSRTGKISLKKGETIFFYVYIPTKKGSLTLKVA